MDQGKRSATAEPQLLFLCREVPWPLNGGARIRNYCVLSALSQRYQIDLVATGSTTSDPPRQVTSLCRCVFVFSHHRRAIRYACRAIESLSPTKSYFTAGQVSRRLRACVGQLVTQYRYRAVHVAELGVSAALPSEGCPPVIYDAHNCEYALLRRREALEPRLFRPALRIDAIRVRALESDLVARSVLVTTPSMDDIEDLAQFCPAVRAKSEVIPNGANLQAYAKVRNAEPEPGCILLTGSMDWRPNRQGLEWFLKEVWPILQATPERVNVRVAGRMKPSLVALLSRLPGVVAVPNPDDLGDELERAQVVVVPVLASSGTRLRVLEAWSAGRPVVTTPAGAYGLAAQDGRDLLIGASPREFAARILRLLRQPDLWLRLRTQALASMSQYDWATIAQRLFDVHARYV